MKCAPQLKKNLISVSALEALGQEISGRDSVLKIFRGSMVVLKDIRRNNLYYLKGNTVTGQVTTSIGLDDDCTRLYHMRLGHTDERSLQALAKKNLLQGAKTCKLKFCEHCVIGKKTKMKFDTAIHCTEVILDYVHPDVWGLTKTTSIGDNHYFLSFINDFPRRCWVYTMRHKREVLELFVE